MKKLTAFENHLSKEYGKKGTAKREKFESDSLDFRQDKMQKDKKEKTGIKLLKEWQKTMTTNF